MHIVASALGHFEAIGNLADADFACGHSFGTAVHDQSVNRALADVLLHEAGKRPIIVDRTLANAFPGNGRRPDHVVEGPVSNEIGQGVGSWGTLLETKKFMAHEHLTTALMVGHANHVGRVVMQARSLGIDSVVPANLPRFFDTDSEQYWTRSLGAWLPREIIGSFVLRAQKKL